MRLCASYYHSLELVSFGHLRPSTTCQPVQMLGMLDTGQGLFSANIIKKQPISEVKRPEGVVCLVMCENP